MRASPMAVLRPKKAPEKRKTGSRKAKDPNNRSRPPSAFFVFMDQFEEFKEKNPEKNSSQWLERLVAINGNLCPMLRKHRMWPKLVN
ncbi:DNA-binding protein MNB1B [Dendrobium catenatum]|uniref:DNA-binding protein MNB1B n=1 Tax=Dendrobium catenatum TaxID=906689 RepID=A0A2I0VCJ2_9ASPA|nr:DNA-binding protein MNB1B [Dendrobium catenatum]